MQKITPCLWFNSNAQEAVDLYTATFKNSKIKTKTHYSESSANASGQPQGSLMTILFECAGFEFLALNGGPHFKFSPANSFFIACETEKEINSYWEKLSGGNIRIELQKYPFAEKYGWCEDKFGVNWQMMLAPRKQKITPALLFVQEQAGRAEEAMKFYTSLFRDSKIESIARDPKTDVILHAVFTLAGEQFVALESNMEHDFKFSLATSYMVNCESQGEIDSIWNRLSAHKNDEQCGWLKDKFDVSWQIVPTLLSQVHASGDAAKTERVMAAVMQMKKIDLKAIEKAAQ